MRDFNVQLGTKQDENEQRIGKFGLGIGNEKGGKCSTTS